MWQPQREKRPGPYQYIGKLAVLHACRMLRRTGRVWKPEGVAMCSSWMLFGWVARKVLNWSRRLHMMVATLPRLNITDPETRNRRFALQVRAKAACRRVQCSQEGCKYNISMQARPSKHQYKQAGGKWGLTLSRHSSCCSMVSSTGSES